MLDGQIFDVELVFKAAHVAKKKAKARKEATTTDLRQYAKQFLQAKKDEYVSWQKNEVFELVDMRKHKPRNFVTGRWVLTIKRDKDGNFVKCKARWVLRGFQDKQYLINRRILLQQLAQAFAWPVSLLSTTLTSLATLI